MAVHSIDAEDDQFAYRYDTQLLIERRDQDLDEDEISDYITEHFEGNSLIAAGDEDLVKIHPSFHGFLYCRYFFMALSFNTHTTTE